MQFDSLPPEILLQVLASLSIPDLLSLSRTSHHLRTLSLDPVLHIQRLHSASPILEAYLHHRPTLDTLCPPNRSIYLTQTQVLARSISRSLTTIRLNRNLALRPDSFELVERGILPKECTTYSSPISPALISARQSILRERLKNGLRKKLQRRPSAVSLVQLNILPEECAPRKGRSAIAPGLVERRRSVIRERLKDGLRVWVEKRAVLMQRRRKAEVDSEIVGVRGLVRRFSSATQDERGIADCAVTMEKKKAHAKWGRELERAKTREKMRSLGATEDGCCSQPTRAHVLGLRRFWEGVIKAAGG